MTFPVLEATARGTETSAVTTHDVVLPATVNAGDILLARFGAHGGAVTWDDATVGPWQVLHNTQHSGDANLRFVACWRVCDGSEDGATLAVTTAASTRSAWHIDRFSGAQAVEAATPTQTRDGPALNPSWGTEDVYWISSYTEDTGFDPGATTPPTDYSGMLVDFTGSGTGGARIFSAYRQLNAESENPGIWGEADTGDKLNNTYAVRAGATLFPPRLDVGVTFFAPSVLQIVAPPRLNVSVQFFAPRVASLQVLAPPRLDVGVTFLAPFIGAGLLPPRLDVGITLFPPTIVKPGTLEPLRLDVGIKFFPPLVEGGFRVIPQFTSLSFGPFPGAIGDAALLNGGPGAALKFENRWNVRGPIGFTDFAPFIAGTYEFNAAYVWLRLMLETPTAFDVAINRALMHIDVPDAIDRGFANIPEDGAWVNFGRTFNVPPEVVAQVVTAIGVTEAPKVTVRDDVEAGRFFAICHTGDSTTTSVAASIKYVAAGY